MATTNEKDLLDRLTAGTLAVTGPALESQPNIALWEELRVSLEGPDPKERRLAAARAARLWRALPRQAQPGSVRLLSGLWRYYSSINDLTGLARIGSRLIRLGLGHDVQPMHAEGLLARGVLLLARGQISEAISTLELSRAIFGTSNLNSHDYIRASIILADAYGIQGDRTSSFAILSRARSLCLESEDIVLLSAVSHTLGIAYYKSGDLRAARRSFEFAIDSSRLLKSARRALRATLGLAIVHVRSGEADAAEALAANALQTAMAMVLPREEYLAREILGEVGLLREDWTAAHSYLAGGMRGANRSELTEEIRAELHRKLAEFWLLYGNFRRALSHVNRAVRRHSEGAKKEDLLALGRLRIVASADPRALHQSVEALISHANEVSQLGYGYEYLLTSWNIVTLADQAKDRKTATEWWSRVVYLAQACGAEPLLERWRREREEKGFLRPTPLDPGDGLEGEPGPHARLVQGLPPVDLAAFNIITRSRRLHEHASSIAQIAPTLVPVLIRGESGTGKELFARLVHDLSPRKDGPFLAINCGAIPTEILESELFGHRRGSFTGAVVDKIGLFRAAHNGTLFLDEIGEMAGPAQTKLLRVLETGELRRIGDTAIEYVDVRIVSATNIDLERNVAQGTFRKDLYYRLRGLDVYLPPLRDRMGDIPLLAAHFLASATSEHPKRLTLPFETQQWLMSLPWPGNVRELRLAVERAVAMAADGAALQPYHFMEAENPVSHASLPDELEAIERARVLHALETANWNKASAARLLGMSRTTLNGRIKKLGIEDPEHPE